ncbi:hypothetical protein QAD02_015462 [Eretmocerus hayati]|uniref:Uncharacterized protein n=1 Tax=Eretmocerus hayati TaxID=131215 RepID=A0ACC2P7V3_9HYME|nr:hypothetical protein QAD02_015462 [Eretmocerus hayati]
MIVLLSIYNCFGKDSNVHHHKLDVKNGSVDDLSEKMVILVKNCFLEESDQFVIAGDNRLFNHLLHEFSSFLPIRIINLAETKMFEKHKRLSNVFTLDENVVSRSRYPAKLFIISLTTFLSDLKLLLGRLKSSIMWNASGKFIIVDGERNSCINRDRIVVQVWEYNILQCIYICLDKFSVIRFYSFNPYTNRSAKAWVASNTVANGKIGLPITIYEFIYPVDRISSCKELFFDKTSNLDGYPVKLIASPRPTEFSLSVNSPSSYQPWITLDSFDGGNAKILRSLWSHVKARALVNLALDEGYLDEHKRPQGLINQLVRQGSYDMGANLRFQRDFWRLQTYPHLVEGMCAISPRQTTFESRSIVGHLPLNQLLIGLCLSWLAGILVSLLSGRSIAESLVEVLRALLGQSVNFKPKSTWRRLVFLLAIIASLGANVYFGGVLSSFLVSGPDSGEIDSLEDLEKSGYLVVGEMSYREFLDFNEELQQRFVDVKSVVELEKLAATDRMSFLCYCSSDVASSYGNRLQYQVYLSNSLYTSHLVYIVREDWPLLNRVNSILERLRDGGLAEFEIEMAIYASQPNSSSRVKRKLINDNSELRGEALRLEHLHACFQLYVLGNFIAIVLFAREILWLRAVEVTEIWLRQQQNKRLRSHLPTA